MSAYTDTNVQQFCRELAEHLQIHHGPTLALRLAEKRLQQRPAMNTYQRNNWRRIAEYLRGE